MTRLLRVSARVALLIVAGIAVCSQLFPEIFRNPPVLASSGQSMLGLRNLILILTSYKELAIVICLVLLAVRLCWAAPRVYNR